MIEPPVGTKIKEKPDFEISVCLVSIIDEQNTDSFAIDKADWTEILNSIIIRLSTGHKPIGWLDRNTQLHN